MTSLPTVKNLFLTNSIMCRYNSNKQQSVTRDSSTAVSHIPLFSCSARLKTRKNMYRIKIKQETFKNHKEEVFSGLQ